GRPQPVAPPQNVAWARPLTSHPLYRARGSAGARSPTAGEEAALRCWRDFLTHRLGDYERARDRPDQDGTSRMSVYLKWAEIHQRTMLSDLARHPSASAAAYASELAWRESTPTCCGAIPTAPVTTSSRLSGAWPMTSPPTGSQPG